MKFFKRSKKSVIATMTRKNQQHPNQTDAQSPEETTASVCSDLATQDQFEILVPQTQASPRNDSILPLPSSCCVGGSTAHEHRDDTTIARIMMRQHDRDTAAAYQSHDVDDDDVSSITTDDYRIHFATNPTTTPVVTATEDERFNPEPFLLCCTSNTTTTTRQQTTANHDMLHQQIQQNYAAAIQKTAQQRQQSGSFRNHSKRRPQLCQPDTWRCCQPSNIASMPQQPDTSTNFLVLQQQQQQQFSALQTALSEERARCIQEARSGEATALFDSLEQEEKATKSKKWYPLKRALSWKKKKKIVQQQTVDVRDDY